MQNDPINTVPLQQFIQQVKIADMSQQKEIKIDIKTAKILSFSIGEIMSRLVQDYEELLSKLSKNDTQVIEVQLDGGGFKTDN